MNSQLFINANKKIKKSRPTLGKDTVCDTYRKGTFLEITFMSKQCKNDSAGSCIMCDYGVIDCTPNSEIYIKRMDTILQKEDGVQYLLLCTNGSIMDSSQIAEETFYKILEYVSNTAIPNIIFETHYLDVTHEKLKLIKQLLPSKNVTIELGMETANQIYQDFLIMKHINLTVFEKVVSTIQGYGFNVDLNILFGLPLLSEKEQFQDTKNSITWAFEHGCNPVIFPVNIKPYTLLMNMYENGYYKPVSYWLLLLLLSTLEEEQLSRIIISYYGNRDENYYDKSYKTIFPACCPVCKKQLLNFYDAFSQEEDSHQKKELINRIMQFDKCTCLKKQKAQLSQPDTNTFKERYEGYSEFLKRNFIM